MKIYLFARETKQHPTDLDEAVPNDVQVKTDTYCTITTLCLVMERDTLLERDRVSATTLSQRESPLYSVVDIDS